MKYKNLIWIAIFLFLINYGLLWVYSKPIPYNTEVLYLPFFIKCFFYCYLAVSTISALLVIVWAAYGLIRFEKIYKKFSAALLSLFLIGQCVIVFISWIQFIPVSYDHIDSLKYKEKYYHLVVVNQYEDKEIILFGECEHTQYLCKFSPIYYSHTFGEPFVNRSNLELSPNRNQVTISWLGETVFVYDEQNQLCADTDELYCWEP